MACEICEHCQTPLSRDERAMVHEGFSYHKRCHKCYVCSETNLQNAEVFKGVIFCSSCAQRIFQGCSTVRRTKTAHAGRMKRTRSRSHRRDRARVQDRRTDRSRDGVIELAGLAGSTTTDSEELKKKKQRNDSKPIVSTELALQDGIDTKLRTEVKNYSYLQQVSQMKRDSIEMGTTTDVTQELLRQINCPIPDCRATHKEYTPQTVYQPRRHHKKKEVIEPKNVSICSDLRIAELGASTEIANMALRKKSELPVIIKSDPRLKGRGSYSLSVLNQESSDVFDEGSESMDSAYSTIDESENTKMFDRRLGSIINLPIKFFKKNILTRSSLISVLNSTDDGGSTCLIRRLKRILREEAVEHQGRGVKRLYSTINRRKAPYKLGWVDLVAKVPKVMGEQKVQCACNKQCRHFKESHSYRCMRAQVMKLAGPTHSELACYRNKIKKFIAPQFLRNIVTSSKYIDSILTINEYNMLTIVQPLRECVPEVCHIVTFSDGQ